MSSAILLMVSAALLVILLIAPSEARRHSPLLVEDEGARRNRPAGKFFITRSISITPPIILNPTDVAVFDVFVGGGHKGQRARTSKS